MPTLVHPMIWGAAVSLVTWILLGAGSFLLMIRLQRWHTLLMTTGAILTILILIVDTTLGFLQMRDVISQSVWQGTRDITWSLGHISSLCFAIGLAAASLHIYKMLPDLAKVARYVDLMEKK
jgi:hypothetical protein